MARRPRGAPRAAPRYFCENCGAEVRRDAKVCPECGRFFSSVRCPKCGFTGAPAKFRNGCPVCGCVDLSGDMAGDAAYAPAPPEAPTQPLPLWTWLIALGVLVGAIAAFISVL